MSIPHLSSLPLAQNPGCNPQCTACHYKALPYEAQLERKNAWAQKQLAPWASVLSHLLPAPEDERLGYRQKSWLWAQKKPHSPDELESLPASNLGPDLDFGMRRAIQKNGRWTQEFVSWRSCPIHDPAIPLILEQLIDQLSRPELAALSNELVGLWFGSPHLVLVTRSPLGEEPPLDWDLIIQSPFSNAWSHVNPQVGRRIFGHQEIKHLFPKHPSDSSRAGTHLASVHPIRAFRQVANTLLKQARAQAVQALLLPKPELIVDLYCGTGELSLLLPPSIAWLGIELSEDAVHFAKTLRTRPPGLADSNSVYHEAYTGLVEHRLADPKVQAKIQGRISLFLNPPRSGLGEAALLEISKLLKRAPALNISYLSCSASSLARELPQFERLGYRVRSLQPFDFFPQTEHFETLACLEPTDSR
jgi:23S rRNA (uracil1939-C5)-methyltransferase